MSEYYSPKYDLDDAMRERNKPSISEIEVKRRHIESNPFLTELEIDCMLEEWIESQTKKNMDEECREPTPFRLAKRRK